MFKVGDVVSFVTDGEGERRDFGLVTRVNVPSVKNFSPSFIEVLEVLEDGFGISRLVASFKFELTLVRSADDASLEAVNAYIERYERMKKLVPEIFKTQDIASGEFTDTQILDDCHEAFSVTY